MANSSQSLRLAIPFLLVPVCFVPLALARETTVTGGADVIYDFRERSYDQKAIDPSGKVGDKKKAGIGPEVTVLSKGLYDTFSLYYAPMLNYDSVTDNSGVDHNLKLSEERYLSRYWTVTVTDDFIRSDDPSLADSSAATYTPFTTGPQPATTSTSGQQPAATPTTPGNGLSRDLSGQKYWTNTATARTVYNLAEDSHIGGGYSYNVLRNDQGATDGTSYEDYDRHTLATDFAYRYNQDWRSSLGLSYTRGLYNNNNNISAGAGTLANTPDLNEYGATFGVDYIDSLKDFFPLKYLYTGTQYDGDTRQDNEAHQWSAGWDHSFDLQTRLALGGGPSYAKTHGQDGTWGYNAYLHFNKMYEHASYALLFDKLYQAQNFTGTNDSGLTDTYVAMATFTYQYTKALGLNVYGRYSWESTLDPQGQYKDVAGNTAYDKNIYEAGTGFNYSFAQWYKAGIKYVYYVSDGKLASDQYTDHQVLFTLSATKDFWRW